MKEELDMEAGHDHLSDQQLSDLVDLSTEALPTLAADHLARCASCTVRLTDWRELRGHLAALPVQEPPRDFTIGPRPLSRRDPYWRLNRWYEGLRFASGAAAAALAFLLGATVYFETRAPGSPGVSTSAGVAAGPSSAGEERAATGPTLSAAARSVVQGSGAAAPARAVADADSATGTGPAAATAQPTPSGQQADATAPAGPLPSSRQGPPALRAALISTALLFALLIVAALRIRHSLRRRSGHS